MDQLQQLSSLLSCQFEERSKLSSDVYRRLHAHRRPTNISLISFPWSNTSSLRTRPKIHVALLALS